MPKLEYKSDSDNESKSSEVIENVSLSVTEGSVAKTPKSEKQIEAVKKMREALMLRRENDKKLKEELESKMDDTLNHKLIKKEINKKVNMKLKKIVDTTNDEASESDEEEIIIIPKKKTKPKPTEVPIKAPIKKEIPAQQIPPKPMIRFV